MRLATLLALLCAVVLAGCSLGGTETDDRGGGAGLGQDAPERGDGERADEESPAPEPPSAEPLAGEPEQARQIRAWSIANNRGQFGRAASYFAPGAIVEQLEETRLPDREAAIAFNRSLPCRAEVTDVTMEGDSFVAAFRLSAGRGGMQSCGGSARVRFRFEGERFTEWRQLGAPEAPEGEIA